MCGPRTGIGRAGESEEGGGERGGGFGRAFLRIYSVEREVEQVYSGPIGLLYGQMRGCQGVASSGRLCWKWMGIVQAQGWTSMMRPVRNGEKDLRWVTCTGSSNPRGNMSIQVEIFSLHSEQLVSPLRIILDRIGK